MKPVFADTGFWIALLHPKDRWHKTAIIVYQEIQKQQRKVVTSEMILIIFYPY
ncbi:hypothetical protein K4A83_17385 [Spirulina subsalsa FACHB-351]|uniref:PIN domain-containing protein n=1 Tax=Spirulina subsalsa FACHB-351 TaxID=234711 RepID=A0ABT3L941_9CYAN|nr:hypothetical protein [Spirulina subsalsa]MCW6038031.1 hypothetical protein [Spirulina subsalsa FACHB-351]